MQSAITALDYYLPPTVVPNSRLAEEFPDWTVDKIEAKTGIAQRHISAPDECSSDLAVRAAQKLFASGSCRPEEVDFLLLCTQSPDYFLPTTACLVQQRLELSRKTGALDFNLGCSGFVYGLGLAKGLIETGQARKVLLLTAETYSKFINPADRSVRTIFGDGAAATLIEAVPSAEGSAPFIGPFDFGTDGRGGCNLMVPTGGMRRRRANDQAQPAADAQGNVRGPEDLYMNGPEIFNFTLEAVPQSIRNVLAAAQTSMDQVDLCVLHQANQYMLEHLRRKLGVSEDKFLISMKHCGNTVSSTIPIALKNASDAGRLRSGQQLLLSGFGVGYSWASALVQWR